MVRFTQFDVDRHQAKNKPKREPDATPEAFYGKESELHSQIEEELKRRQWLYIHSRTDKRTTTAKGIPDFAIFPRLSHNDDRRAVFVECKTRLGKLTPEQQAFKVVAEISGYGFHVCRTFQEFLKAIE